MRTTIKVEDLSLAQWDWLKDHLPESREFGPNTVRMCVEFDLSGRYEIPRHVEMPPREFVVLVNTLAKVERDHLAKLAAEWERVDPDGVAVLRKSAAALTDRLDK